MKSKLFLSAVCVFSLATFSYAADTKPTLDSSLAKRVEALESKVKTQQKELNALKENKKTTTTLPSTNASQTKYVIERRGSKQFIKVN